MRRRRGGAALVLAAGSAQGWISEAVIFAVVFVIGAARAFEMPTMAALLPALVPPAKLPRAVATNATATQTAIIAGPAVGGFVYVAGPGGGLRDLRARCSPPASSCSRDCATTTCHRRASRRRCGRCSPASRFIRRQPVMLGAISLDLFAVFLGGATALLPIYARDILDTGAWGLGPAARGAGAIGALATALLPRAPAAAAARRAARCSRASPIFGAATIVFGLSTVFLLSFAALVVMGAADMVSVVIRSSLVQLSTPDAMRGRVSAVNSVFIGASNQLGEFESGVTAAWFGAVPAVVIGGVGTLLVVGALDAALSGAGPLRPAGGAAAPLTRRPVAACVPVAAPVESTLRRRPRRLPARARAAPREEMR